MYQFTLPKIHKEGLIFIAIFFIVSVILSNISNLLGIFGFVLTIWCTYFFRDPNRIVPNEKNLVLSSADGVVQNIVENSSIPEELELTSEENWDKS